MWGTLNNFVQKVSHFKTFDELKGGTMEEKRAFEERVNMYIEELAKVPGVDLREELTDHREAMYATELYHQHKQMFKSDADLYKNMNRAFGWAISESFYSDRQRLFAQIKPIEESYNEYMRLVNYSTDKSADLQKQLHGKLKEFGREIKRSKMPLKGRNLRKVLMEQLSLLDDSVKNGEQQIRDNLMYDHHFSNEEASEAISALQSFQKSINLINYGYETKDELMAKIESLKDERRQFVEKSDMPDDEKQALLAVIDGTDPHKYILTAAGNDSIMGYYRNAFKVWRNFYNKRDGSSNRLGEKGEDFFNEKINDFTGRFNYFPSKKSPEDSVMDMIQALDDSPDIHMVKTPEFLNRRKQALEQGNPLDIFANNIIYFDYAISHMTKFVMLNNMRETLDTLVSGDFFSSQKDEDIKKNTVLYKYINHYLDAEQDVMMNDIRGLEKPWEKTLRNLANMNNIIPSLMLAMPNTALNNFMGGAAQILTKYGLAHTIRLHGEYKRAKKNTAIGKIVDEYSHLFVIGLGKTAEFKSDERAKEFENFALKRSQQLRDLANKTADIATSKGALGWLSFLDVFTLKGSEAKLREIAAMDLYYRVRNDAALKGITDQQVRDDPSKIDGIVRDYVSKIQTEQNMALGNFNNENKPFHVTALDKGYLGSKTPESVKKWVRGHAVTRAALVQMGAAAKLWYCFRKVPETNLGLLKDSIMNGVNFKPTQIYAKNSKSSLLLPAAPGLANFGLLMYGVGGLLYNLLTKHFDRKGTPRVSPIVNANWAEDLLPGPRLLVTTTLGVLNNWKMDEDMYEETINDALRWGLGVLGGEDIERVAEQIYKDDPEKLNTLETVSKMIMLDNNALGMVLSGAYAIGDMGLKSAKFVAKPISGKPWEVGSELYERQKVLRESLGNKYKIDPIYLYEKILEMGFIARGADEDAKRTIKSQGIKTAGKFLLTSAGLNIYMAPEMYKRKETARWDARRYYERLTYMRDLDYTMEAHKRNLSSLANQVLKYGKFYINPVRRSQ